MHSCLFVIDNSLAIAKKKLVANLQRQAGCHLNMANLAVHSSQILLYQDEIKSQFLVRATGL